jgi:hypothetical protein
MRFIEINLRVAFIRGNDKPVAVGQRKERLPGGKRHHGPRGVPGRADIDELRALPDGLGQIREIVLVTVVRQRVEEMRRCPGEQGRALVDLVERIGADYDGIGAGWIDHRLSECEQGLAAAVDRHDFGLVVDRVQPVPPLQPFCDRLPQSIAAQRRRVRRKTVQIAYEGLLDEIRCRMLGFADMQCDRLQAARGRRPFQEFAQLLERVSLEPVEIRVHGGYRTSGGAGQAAGEKRRL